MHELSIAQSLVEMAVRSLAHVRVQRVVEVRVAIGALSGVAAEALLFAYDVVTEGTPLAGSTLVIRHVPAIIRCANCQRDATVDDEHWLSCPTCGTPSGDLRGGRELDLESLEVETIDD